MANRKCSHALPEIAWRPDLSLDGPFSMRCPKCGEQLSLGTASEPAEDVRAAELEETDRWAPDHWTTVEMFGEQDHDEPEIESSADGFFGTASWSAGWLAREIATHDDRATRDANAWSWDPTRPVAGQWEEHAEREAGMVEVLEIVRLGPDGEPDESTRRITLCAEIDAELDAESEATDQMSMSALDELEADEP